MMPLYFASEVVRPGDTVRVVCVFVPPWPEQPAMFSRLHLDVTPAVRAAFQIERVDVLSPAETLELGARGIVSGAVLLRVKNMSEEPRAFEANLVLVPNEDVIRTDVAHTMETDWAEAYDRALRELRARTNN